MTLIKVYTKRAVKLMLNRKSILDMGLMWAVIMIISLLSRYLPYTPLTEKSLVTLVENYFNMPITPESLDFAFFTMELPLLVGLLATTTTVTVPMRTLIYEKVTGNIEIILSYYRDINEFIKATLVSTIGVSLVAYILYSSVGLLAIVLYKALYGVKFSLPTVFYLLMFVLNPLIILLSSSLAVLIPVIRPSLASIDLSAPSSNNPVVLFASLPPILLFVIATLFPLYIPKIAIYVPPITALIFGITLLLAKKTMRRDRLVRR
ncbi:hypothetical protein A3L04_09670 [Thermococcus chitonophagus]|uniref:Uncharacterized protein n=1 Tax=Thermococcus chitonophagus TaxID=54262 RepID=A0A161KIU0_9EURY|nr:hypothetical protein [Thermococcus chitonophagus]ASJ17317.1 hypothetical protein A3L04_09670 [Thermococcus chitonophagus]CUX77948.1 hypothetical protein CHITON_1169 [Thermococcus chitonophagus]